MYKSLTEYYGDQARAFRPVRRKRSSRTLSNRAKGQKRPRDRRGRFPTSLPEMDRKMAAAGGECEARRDSLIDK